MARRQPELWDEPLRNCIKTLAAEMDHGQEPGLLLNPSDLTSDEDWLDLAETAQSLGMTVAAFKHDLEDFPWLKGKRYRRVAPASGRGKPPFQYHQPSLEMWYRNRSDQQEERPPRTPNDDSASSPPQS